MQQVFGISIVILLFGFCYYLAQSNVSPDAALLLIAAAFAVFAAVHKILKRKESQ